MILDSEIWKNDLKKETKKIKKFFAKWDFEEDDSIGKPFITLQKFSIYTSVVIRKLIDVRKISDELLECVLEFKHFALK
jgi:predicted restriction endonuclease